MPFGRGITLLRGLTVLTMVINHLQSGMILQVCLPRTQMTPVLIGVSRTSRFQVCIFPKGLSFLLLKIKFAKPR